jgi:hypothetical protein
MSSMLFFFFLQGPCKMTLRSFFFLFLGHCCPRSGEGSSRDQEEAQARERLVRGPLAADRLRKPKQRNRHLLLLSSLACLWHTIRSETSASLINQQKSLPTSIASSPLILIISHFHLVASNTFLGVFSGGPIPRALRHGSVGSALL